MFLPFELLEHGKALNPSGTGIGLSSCHKMLTAIGCSIKLEESVVGTGSIFSFTILFEKVDDNCSIRKRVIQQNKKSKFPKDHRHPNFGSRSQLISTMKLEAIA